MSDCLTKISNVLLHDTHKFRKSGFFRKTQYFYFLPYCKTDAQDNVIYEMQLKHSLWQDFNCVCKTKFSLFQLSSVILRGMKTLAYTSL